MSRFNSKAAGIVLGGLVLNACTSAQLSESGSGLSLGGSEYVLPVRSVVERRYLTVVRQRYDFSCGSAALATLLHFHYGDAQNEQSIFLGMWRDGDQSQIRRLGFSLLDMKRYLNARGVAADGYQVNLAQVQAAGIPGIALINMNGYRHFVVIKGIENGQVLVGDPSLGIRLVGIRSFEKMWNGVIFVINGDIERGKGSFGRESEWALVARARATALMEPVSLQALSLTRAQPFPLEI